jgi:anti-anti-sigma factor
METFTWEERDGARWIVFEGDLDHQQVMALQDRFRDVVLKGDEDVVVVLQGVTFLGSVAVGLLLEARKELAGQGRTLKLSGASSVVRTALKLMNLDSMFTQID